MNRITLQWKNIKFNIDEETRRVADVTITDESVKFGAQSDSTDEDFCLTKASEAVALLRDLLHDFISYIDSGSDNSLKTFPSINIDFVKSPRANIDTETLAYTLHSYVALYIIREWARGSFPKMLDIYTNNLAEVEARILNSIYRKQPPIL